MTETTNYRFNHNTFGGIIFHSDFNTDYRGHDNTKGSQIAQRIISDQKFDYRCKRNIEMRSNKKQEEFKNA